MKIRLVWVPLRISSCHNRRRLSPSFCYPLTPRNSMAAFPTLRGSFVSPMRVALYARVSTHDQHTLAMQMDAMREFATRRHWTVTDAVEEIASAPQTIVPSVRHS